MSRVINALEALHANLPPTLSKSQVSSVRKHLKLQLFLLCKHPMALGYAPQLTTLLSDLGATPHEMGKQLPPKFMEGKSVSSMRCTASENSEFVDRVKNYTEYECPIVRSMRDLCSPIDGGYQIVFLLDRVLSEAFDTDGWSSRKENTSDYTFSGVCGRRRRRGRRILESLLDVQRSDAKCY